MGKILSKQMSEEVPQKNHNIVTLMKFEYQRQFKTDQQRTRFLQNISDNHLQ